MKSAVVVGNPKPASRTLAAATYVAGELSGRESDLVVDLATLGAAAAHPNTSKAGCVGSRCH